jgi:hypothetical protein
MMLVAFVCIFLAWFCGDSRVILIERHNFFIFSEQMELIGKTFVVILSERD